MQLYSIDAQTIQERVKQVFGGNINGFIACFRADIFYGFVQKRFRLWFLFFGDTAK